VRPLYDALRHGCCSIEADVLLVRGRLMVAHGRWTVLAGRDLDRMYLRRLRELVRRGEAPFAAGGRGLWLLIDFKTAPAPTYAALRPLLERYRDMLTVYTPEGVRRGPVTVVLSGSRPAAATLAAEPERLVAVDGRIDDLERDDVPASLMPWISDRFARVTRWRGRGPMPEADRRRLRGIVRRAHAQGRLVRLWGTPDDPRVWKELAAAGVDLVNADDLAGARRFLRAWRTAGSAATEVSNGAGGSSGR